MADFSKLVASIAKVSSDFDTYVANSNAAVQPQIDAAQAAVDAVDTKIVAATPAAPAPTA